MKTSICFPMNNYLYFYLNNRGGLSRYSSNDEINEFIKKKLTNLNLIHYLVRINIGYNHVYMHFEKRIQEKEMVLISLAFSDLDCGYWP